jgi:hypothetical protein
MPANSNEIERRLWDAADELRANSRRRERHEQSEEDMSGV